MSDRGWSEQLVEPFYEVVQKGERMAFPSGQVCWAPAIYPYEQPLYLELQNYDPRNESAHFSLRIRPPTDDAPKHTPIKALSLEANESLLVVKAKKRPVVVLGSVEVVWLDNPQKLIVCVPLFTFKARHSDEAVLRIQAFQIPNHFYLPPDPRHRRQESVARLELTQPIGKGWLQPFHGGEGPVRLTMPARTLLTHQFMKFCAHPDLDRRLEEEIGAYRELLLESYGLTPTES